MINTEEKYRLVYDGNKAITIVEKVGEVQTVKSIYSSAYLGNVANFIISNGIDVSKLYPEIDLSKVDLSSVSKEALLEKYNNSEEYIDEYKMRLQYEMDLIDKLYKSKEVRAKLLIKIIENLNNG